MNKWICWVLFLLLGVANAAPKQVVEFLQAWQVCPAEQYLSSTAGLTCHEIQLPSPWEVVMPSYDGFAVFKNQFQLLEKNHSLAFFANQIRDADKVFINGHLIGEMGEFPPAFAKAVLYPRNYSIPAHVLNPEGVNDILIWVYNDARPGGFANSEPQVVLQQEALKHLYENNSISLGIMMALLMVGLIHLIHFAFNRRLLDSLSFGVFSLLWVAYIWTYSGFAAESACSLNFKFKMNVVLFFGIFAIFPIFITQFFNQKLPWVLKTIIVLTLLCIPVVMFLPEPGMAYLPLELVELMTIPSIISIFWIFRQAITEEKPYAKLMVWVLMVYIVFGSADIWLDYFQVVNDKSSHLLGPWALLLLSLVVTMILAHKHRIHHDQATMDQLTQTLRLNAFIQQLEDLKARANIKKQSVLVMMLDVDDFKRINDSLGHVEGNRVLKQVAEDMSRLLRPHDLLGRYGGDEFCLACLLDDKDTAQKRVHYLHLASQQPRVRLDHRIQNIRTTIGIYVSQLGDELNAEELIHKADAELVKGKATNKGGIFGRLTEG